MHVEGRKCVPFKSACEALGEIFNLIKESVVFSILLQGLKSWMQRSSVLLLPATSSSQKHSGFEVACSSQRDSFMAEPVSVVSRP